MRIVAIWLLLMNVHVDRDVDVDADNDEHLQRHKHKHKHELQTLAEAKSFYQIHSMLNSERTFRSSQLRCQLIQAHLT